MRIRSDKVAEVDVFGKQPDGALFAALWHGDYAAVRVRSLVSVDACRLITERILESAITVNHADVSGLRVIGLSHFQAVRNLELKERYWNEARTSGGVLRALSVPYSSPFDSALAFLAQVWPFGCQIMELPTEGPLTPFTIRLYGDSVGIEPHQDILSAESPTDVVASSLTKQFGANIYLSMGTNGGDLELFETDYSQTQYKDLAHGPHVIARELLANPVMITPEIGDLLIFSSHRVHAVTATSGEVPRITVSFFIGVENDQSSLKIWA